MLVKLIRLGRDAELRTTQGGKQLLSFAGAYDIGFGQNKRTQWIDCTIWGDKAATVAQFFKKGTKVVIYASDVELEQYTAKDGSMGAKLKCRVIEFDFAGDSAAAPAGGYQQTAPQPAPQQAPAYSAPSNSPQAFYQAQAARQAPQPAPGGFDDFDDKIPF